MISLPTQLHTGIAWLAVFLLLGSVFGPVSFAQAQFNPEINYQGKLADNLGVPVTDGTYELTFRLYTVPTGGSAIWSEVQNVTVTNGLFAHLLGSSSTISSVDFNQSLYLGVEVASDGEMTPRKILGVVPAAFEAQNAQTLDNIATSSFLRSDQTDTASSLLTFSGGLRSTASSTITNLTTTIATTTTLVINNEAFTNLTGSGLQNSGGVLTVDTAALSSSFASTSDFDTEAELEGILTDVTNIFTDNDTITSANIADSYVLNTGDAISGDLTFSGSAANVVLGSNFISGDGGDEGLSVNSNGRVNTTFADATTEGVMLSFSTSNARTLQLLQPDTADVGDPFTWFTNNAFTWRVDATDALTISENGNVGIGTTTPANRLTIDAGTGDRAVVISSSDNDANIQIGDDDTVGYITVRNGVMSLGSGQSDLTNNLSIDVVTNRFGIATTTPNRTLTVDGDVRITGALYDNADTAGSNGEVLQSTATGLQWVATSSLGLGSPFGSSINASELANEDFGDFTVSGGVASLDTDVVGDNEIDYGEVRLSDFTNDAGFITDITGGSFLDLYDTPGSFTANRVLYTTGSAVATDADLTFNGANLGLGTTDPITNLGNGLTISGTNQALFLEDTSVSEGANGRMFRFRNVDGTFVLSENGRSGSVTTGSSDLLVIDSSGNVGIGTTSPATRLQVVDETGGSGLLITGASGTNETARLQTVSGATNRGELLLLEGTTGNTLVRLTSESGAPNYFANGGNVGIGTTTPEAELHVEGAANDIVHLTANNPAILFEDTNSSNVYIQNSNGSLVFERNDGTTANMTLTQTGALSIAGALTVSGGDMVFGTTPILSGGDVTSLDNIDAINPTTEATIESAIDSLTNLTSVGTITSGVWNGTALTDTYVSDTLTIGTSSNIADGLIAEADLDIANAPSDELCLTYESDTGNFAWQSCASGSLTTADIDTSAELAAILTDEVGDGFVVFNNDSDFTGTTTLDVVQVGPAAANAFLTAGDGGVDDKYPIVAQGYQSTGPLYQQLRLDAGTTNGYLQGAISMVSDDFEVAAIGYQGDDDAGNNGILTFSTRQSGTLTEAMRINEFGYVGVGDLTPSSLFNVGAGNASTVDGANDLFVTDDIEADGDLYIAGNGNFGAGLDVTGTQFSTTSASFTGLVIDSSPVTAGDGEYGVGIEFSKLGASSVKKAAIVPVQTNADDDWLGLAFFAGNSSVQADPVTEAMRIDGFGRVGIGTTSPQFRLDVQNSNGGSLIRAADTDSTYDGVQLWADTAAGAISNASGFTSEAIYLQNSLNALRFYTNGSEAMRLDNANNLSLAGDTDTYISNAAANELAFTTGAAERLRIDASGNVGIGNTNPQALLEVGDADSSSSISQGNLIVKATVDDTAIVLQETAGAEQWGIGVDNAGNFFLADSGNTTTPAFVIEDNTGNVGIGNTSPSQALDIGAEPSGTNWIRLQRGGASNSGIEWYRSQGPAVDAQIYVDSNEDLRLSNDFGGDILLESNRVGIGTTTPTSALTIANTNSTVEFGNIQTVFESSGTSGISDFLIIDQDNSSSRAALQVQGNGGATEVLFAASGGRVGIGTTTPTAELDIRGVGSQTAIKVDPSDTGYILSSYNSSATGDPNQFNILHNAGGVDIRNERGAISFSSGSTVVGATSLDGGAFQVVGDEVRIGGEGTINSATGDGDLYVEDTLEVDGALQLAALAGGLLSTDGSGNVSTTSVVASDLADGDFGDFTMTGGVASLDANVVSDNEIDYSAVTLNDFTFDVGSVDKTEFGYLNGVTSGIQGQIDGKEGQLNNEAGLYAALSDVTQFWEAGDTINSGTLALDSLSYTGTIGTTEIDDVFVLNTGDTIAGTLRISTASDELVFDSTTGPHTIRFDNVDLRFWSPTSSEIMRLEEDTGNVGIGTAGPNTRLHVAVAGAALGTDLVTIAGAEDSMVWEYDAAGDYFLHNTQQDNGFKFYDGTGGVEVWYNGAAVAEWDSSGGMDILSGGINVTGNITVTGTVDGKDIANNAGFLNEAETITANWVNTANPWADNEVSDAITVGNTGTVNTLALSDGGTISFDWTNAEVSDTLTIGSGSTVAGDAITDGTIDSSEIGDNTITAADLLATNTEADNDIVTYDSGGGFSFNTPSEIITAGTGLSWSGTTLNSTVSDTNLTQEEVQDFVGTMVTGNTETGIAVTYDDAGDEFDFVLDTTGDWTGTLDGVEGANFLRSDTSDSAAGMITFNGGITLGSGDVIVHSTTESRDKIRVWSSGQYAIGMDNNYTFGALNNDYAMTFQMNNDTDRGWWWGDASHTDAQGAMALNTTGDLTIAESVRVGYGQTDTTVPGGTYALDISGAGNLTGNLDVGSGLDVTGNITVTGTVDGKDIATNAGFLNEAETISANWVNTANPWADNEVSDTLTIGSGGSVGDGALSANVALLDGGQTFSAAPTFNAGASLGSTLTFQNSETISNATDGALTIAGHLYPAADNTYDIGEANGTNEWRNAFFDGTVRADVLRSDGDVLLQGGDLYDNGGDFAVRSEDNLYFTMDYNNNDADTRYISFGKNDNVGSFVTTNELMRIQEDGNVGIGTTTPTERLTVAGNVLLNDTTRPSVAFDKSNGSVDWSLGSGVNNDFYIKPDRFDTDSSDADAYLTIETIGEIGIGTINPTELLHVAGDTRIEGALYDNANSAGTNGMVLQSTGTGFNWVATSTLGLGGSSLFTDAGATTYLTSLTDNLAIGTSTSEALLTISSETIGDAQLSIIADTDNSNENDNPYLYLSQDGGAVTALLGLTGDAGNGPAGELYTNTLQNATLLGSEGAYPLQLGVNSSVAMTVATDGDVGIGTNGPAARLHVSGGAGGSVLIEEDGSGYGSVELLGSNGAYIDFKNNSADDYDARILTGGSGLLFSTASTTNALTIQNDGDLVASDALIVNGAFTSVGIDDNATARALIVSDTSATFGQADAAYTIRHLDSDQLLGISGGSAGNSGANMLLYGGSHATAANDFAFRSGATTVLRWDDSADQWEFEKPISLEGTINNIALGSNYLSGDGGDEGIYIDSAGNVGIGTSTPDNILYVVGDTPPYFSRSHAADGSSSRAVLGLERTYPGGAGADGIGAHIDFWAETETEGAVDPIGQFRVVTTDATQGTIDSDIFIKPYLDGTAVDALTLKSSGNVGIGTTSPLSKLTLVDGNFTIFGSTDAGDDDFNTLLVDGDGADASTSFTDDSPAGRTLTANGNAQVDTAQSQFGGASMLFDGTGDYIEAADSTDWDLSDEDFTYEFWFRPANTSAGLRHILGQYTTGALSPLVIWQSGTNIVMYSSSAGSTWDVANNRTIATVSASTWYHIAVVRNGDTFTTYLDGVETDSFTNTQSFFNSIYPMRIGGSNSAYFFNGHMDEVRITKGLARYVGDFTPPDQAFAPPASTDGYIGLGVESPAFPIEHTSGAKLTQGGGWTNASDVNLKENFEAVDTEDILARVAELELTTWNYIVEDDSFTHLGPMAQDFYGQFRLGGSETSISTIDTAGVALASVQALDTRWGALAAALELSFATSSTSTILVLETKEGSFWERLQTLVAGFVDGVLIIAGLETDEVQTEELCIGDTCVDEATLIQLLQNANNPASPPADNSDGSSDDGNNNDPVDDPISDDGSDPDPVTNGTSTATSTATTTDDGSEDTTDATSTSTEPVNDDADSTTETTTEDEGTEATIETTAEDEAVEEVIEEPATEETTEAEATDPEVAEEPAEAPAEEATADTDPATTP